MRDNMLYRKVGGRYQPVGFEFTGFPAEGVWYVASGRESLMMKVGDLNDPAPLAALTRYRDLAATAVSEVIAGNPGRPLTATEMVNIAFLAVCQAAEQEPKVAPLSSEEVHQLRGMMHKQEVRGPAKRDWLEEQRQVEEEKYRKLAQAGYAKAREVNGHEC